MILYYWLERTRTRRCQSFVVRIFEDLKFKRNKRKLLLHGQEQPSPMKKFRRVRFCIFESFHFLLTEISNTQRNLFFLKLIKTRLWGIKERIFLFALNWHLELEHIMTSKINNVIAWTFFDKRFTTTQMQSFYTLLSCWRRQARTQRYTR